MSARKKSVRTRKAKLNPAVRLRKLQRLVYQLREVTNYLHKAYKGVARDYYCEEVPMLKVGIEDLRSLVTRLERFEVRFADFRNSNGDVKGGDS